MDANRTKDVGERRESMTSPTACASRRIVATRAATALLALAGAVGAATAMRIDAGSAQVAGTTVATGGATVERLARPEVRPIRQYTIAPGLVFPLLAFDVTGDGLDDILSAFGGWTVVTMHTPQGIRRVSAQVFDANGAIALPSMVLPPGGPGVARLAAVTGFSGGPSDLVYFAVAPLRIVSTVRLQGSLLSPVIADLDANGDLEVVGLGSSGVVTAYDAASGALEWSAGQAGGPLAVAQLDADPALEIIVPGTPGRVLDGATRGIDFEYAPGFGGGAFLPVAAGNLDADPAGEFVALGGAGVQVFESNPIRYSHEFANPEGARRIGLADIDRDGIAEVLVPDRQFGEFSAHRASDGAVLSEVANPGTGDIVGFVAADLDGVGRAEYMISGDGPAGSEDYLAIGRLDPQPVQFDIERARDSVPRLVAVADVDADGADDYVAWNGSEVHVVDRATAALKWRGRHPGGFFISPQVGVAAGQLDADPQLELVIGNFGRYAVVDGASFQQQGDSGDLLPLGVNEIRRVAIADVDADGDQDIVATHDDRFTAFEGRSHAVLWQGPSAGGAPDDVQVGEFDGDPAQEVLVATGANTTAYDAGTRLVQWRIDGRGLWVERAAGPAAPVVSIYGAPLASLVDARNGTSLAGTAPLFSNPARGWWQRGRDGLDTLLLMDDRGLSVVDGASALPLAQASLGWSTARDAGLVVRPDAADPYRVRVVAGSPIGVLEFEVDTWRGIFRDGVE
jgi:hypothetical protein